jgi:hypothetical protein
MDERIMRLRDIETKLHNIANSYSGDLTGPVAVELHRAAGYLHEAIDMAVRGPTKEDKRRQLTEWFMEHQPALANPQMVEMLLAQE